MPDPLTGGIAAGGTLLGQHSTGKALGAQEKSLEQAGALTQEGLEYQKDLYRNLMNLYGDVAGRQLGQTRGFYEDYRRNVNPYLMGGGLAYNQVLGQLGLPMQQVPMMGLVGSGPAERPTGGMRQPIRMGGSMGVS